MIVYDIIWYHMRLLELLGATLLSIQGEKLFLSLFSTWSARHDATPCKLWIGSVAEPWQWLDSIFGSWARHHKSTKPPVFHSDVQLQSMICSFRMPIASGQQIGTQATKPSCIEAFSAFPPKSLALSCTCLTNARRHALQEALNIGQDFAIQLSANAKV